MDPPPSFCLRTLVIRHKTPRGEITFDIEVLSIRGEFMENYKTLCSDLVRQKA